ncbi:MAG: peptidylprolyl isomerase [Arcobacter butzleri]|nr:peptidylprolyl isomerase [Aliarcobacter butzleri]
MITWMQRHKKWLVITIWISTIAFVGAGFVGWGAYDFGKSEGTIAKVGKKEISMGELQREYGNLYSQYSSVFGDKFTHEQAKQIGLERIALQSLIKKYLLLSYASDIGVDATDQELAQALVEINSFKKDGVFNKDQYLQILKQNRMTTVEFEKILKNDLIIDKVQSLFQINNKPKEVEDISSLIFMKDNIKIKIVNLEDISLDISDDELKGFWEENKNNYLTSSSYDIETYEVATSNIEPSEDELLEFYEKSRSDYVFEDGKIQSFEEAKESVLGAYLLEQSKNNALRTYLALKKGEDSFQKTIKIFSNDADYEEYLEEISNLKDGDLSKPFVVNDSYHIIKLGKSNKPSPMEFEEAKELALNDYKRQSSKQALISKAEQELAADNLNKLGFVTRESIEDISNLRSEEANEFLIKLFDTQSKEGIIELNNKVVAYKIVDSELGEHSDNKEMLVSNTILDIKNNELFSNLLQMLEQKYEVISYMK